MRTASHLEKFQEYEFTRHFIVAKLKSGKWRLYDYDTTIISHYGYVNGTGINIIGVVRDHDGNILNFDTKAKAWQKAMELEKGVKQW